MAGFHTEFKGDTIMLGACPIKIMIVEIRFLLTSFDLTSAIFKNHVFGTDKKLLGGVGDLGFGGYPRGPPHV